MTKASILASRAWQNTPSRAESSKPIDWRMQAIDTMALNLKNKWVFPPCLAFAKGAIQSGDPHMRAAACTVMVVVAEGCCDACTSQLAEVLQVCSAHPLTPLTPSQQLNTFQQQLNTFPTTQHLPNTSTSQHSNTSMPLNTVPTAVVVPLSLLSDVNSRRQNV